MAGFRLTLKKLAKKYGIDIEGSTYRQVVEEIVKDNVNRASKKMGEISNRRYKQAFQDSIDDGIIQLPEYAVPAVTVRKASQDGKMITDTLRDTLVRDLRKAITDNPNDTEKAIAQMAQSVSDDMKQYQNVHSKVIAVTEVRSAVDLSKYEYAKELMNRNQGRLKVTKKWVHNDHLVKIPRPTHKAIDGEIVPFGQNFSIGLAYPHDPNAKAEDVIGCQCGYQIEVEEMATNQILKELKEGLKVYKDIQAEKVMKASKASINPATGKPYQIGEEKTMPDGTVKVKTSTFGWSIKGSKDANEAQKKDTNKDGVVDDKDKKKTTSKKTDTKKKEWTDFEGQSAQDATDIAKVYGEKGIYQLTKGGLLNFLHANGVEDPTTMKWAEKVEKYKEIVADLSNKKEDVKIQTAGKEEFKEEDFHILHNSGLYGDASRLENEVLKTRNGDVMLKFTEDGGLTDQTYDELMQKVDPIQGGHWGSAGTRNDTALAVALVNAPEWKPIDKMQNGQLANYNQELTDGQYMSALVKGMGLRKYAQEHLKHPDMSREKYPNFFRGMTVDASQYEQILRGEVDTIELTGCTAVTSFEEVADQYAGSSWTKSFGAGRRSIKLVIERDDYMDNSIGMFHPNTKGYAHGNSNVAFELLSGSPSFYIKSFKQMGEWDKNESAKQFKKNFTQYDYPKYHKDNYDAVKDVDIASLYNPNGYYKYTIKDNYGNKIVESDYYYDAKDSIVKLKAKSEVADLNKQIEDWCTDYYKNNAEDFFKKIKNGRIDHANNIGVVNEWNQKLREEWEKTDLYKKVEEIRNTPHQSRYELNHKYNIDKTYTDVSDDKAEMKKMDQLFTDPELLNNHKRSILVNPIDQLSPRWRMNSGYTDWKDSQPSKLSGMTMKMYLNKQEPLEKSYATQMKKTENEYSDYENFYKWRNEVMSGISSAYSRIIADIRQKYPELTDKDIKDMTSTDGKGEIINLYSAPYDLRNRMDNDKFNELNGYCHKIRNSKPQLDRDQGLVFGRGWGDKLDIKDNPFLTDEQKKSPYATKDLNYSDRRYSQLANIRSNYENAKKNNELSKKYDVVNTPHATITKMRDGAVDALKKARENQKNYIIDKFVEDYKVKHNLNVSDEAVRSLKDNLFSGYNLSNNMRNEFDEYKRQAIDNDKDYLALTQELTKADEKYSELTTVDYIYKGYNEKMADAHKSSKPLELHVVCGRGKKALSASADDDQGEENDN